MKAALKRAIAKGVRNPFTMNQLVGVGQQSVTLDDQLTAQDMVDLGMQFRDFDPEELDLYVPPTRGGNVGAASVVFLDERAAEPIFDIFRGVDPENVEVVPTVRVEVRNGSGKSGQGRTALEGFRSAGFVAARSVDARDFRYPGTIVLYAPGQELAAAHVARYLDGEPTFQMDESLSSDVDVAVVTGSDFVAVRADPRPIEDFQSFLDEAATSTTESVPDESETTTTTPGFVPEAPPGVSC
jgi:hypothetical protein